MQYKSVYDEPFKGYDISIYTHEDNTCTVDVKHPCGELVAGWCDVVDFESAMWTAKEFIIHNPKIKTPHCDDEWCMYLN